MLTGKNNSMLKKLSNRNLKEHKARNILLFMIITILTLLTTALNILGSSTVYNMQHYYFQQYGNTSHVQITDIESRDLNKIRNYNGIENYGISIRIGNAIHSRFEERPTIMRYADLNYAAYALGTPENGRMPENKEEIAVDTTVLEDLGLPEKLGTTMELCWNDLDGKSYRNNFKVVGIWEGNMICPYRSIWLSEEFVQMQKSKKMDLSLNFRKSKHIEKSLEKMTDHLLININAVTNWVYDDHVQHSFTIETLAYKLGVILVLICGFLMIFNIVNISVTSDIRLYGRMKTMGASPRQICFIVFRQLHFISVIGIIAGLLAGYAAAVRMVPIIIDHIDISVIVFWNTYDFMIAAIYIYALVVIAGIRPACFASSVNPLELLNEEGCFHFSNKSYRRTPGFPVLFQISLSNIGRYKKRNIVAVALLTMGLVMMNCIYVINLSFDMNKYCEEFLISDFAISERTLVNSWGKYNPQGNTINEELMKVFEDTNGIVEEGTLYSQDCSIKLTEDAYKNITSYYEQKDDDKISYMTQDAAWLDGYQQLKETKECSATVFGVDGLAKDEITEEKRILDGIIDQEQFAEDNYILAGGVLDEENLTQPTFKIGDTIEISGKKFIIMAVIDVPYAITDGKPNSDSAFSLQFFLTTNQFKKLYPKNTPRKLFLNTSENKKEKIYNVIEKMIRNNELLVACEKTIINQYKKETKSASMMQNIVISMVVVIGIVNVINSIITSIRERKKEFAIMQSIGMTKKQLRTMLILEGLNLMCLILLGAYFFSFVAISVGVEPYLKTQWASTYRFSIMPLLAVTPVLIAVSVLVPMICFHYIQKEEILVRMGEDGDLLRI